MQYIVELSSKSNLKFNYGIAQQLHGYIYEVLGNFLNHDKQRAEFTQFIYEDYGKLKWVINVEDNETIFKLFVDNLNKISLNNDYRFEVTNVEKVDTVVLSNRYELEIVTPAFFKTNGKYHANFSKRALINYMVNTLPRSEYMIKDVINDLEENLLIEDFSFENELVAIKKIKTQGIKGNIVIRYLGSDKVLLNKMLNKLQLRGLGVKPALGFGGLIIKELDEK